MTIALDVAPVGRVSVSDEREMRSCLHPCYALMLLVGPDLGNESLSTHGVDHKGSEYRQHPLHIRPQRQQVLAATVLVKDSLPVMDVFEAPFAVVGIGKAPTGIQLLR